jgi:hypothetical protein
MTTGVAKEYIATHDGKVWPAAATFVRDLMRGNPEKFHLGYSIGNALIAAADQFDLDTNGVAIVAEKVVESTTEHHSATSTPLVVAFVDGGLVQHEIVFPGLGTPQFDVLDFDREGATDEDVEMFVENADKVFTEIRARGGEIPDYPWMERLDSIRRSLHPDWPVDHADGKE